LKTHNCFRMHGQQNINNDIRHTERRQAPLRPRDSSLRAVKLRLPTFQRKVVTLAVCFWDRYIISKIITAFSLQMPQTSCTKTQLHVSRNRNHQPLFSENFKTIIKSTFLLRTSVIRRTQTASGRQNLRVNTGE
jgi:hypothetical protein